jgi:TetR/AcrR family transcriptional repressor of nem operon
LGERSRQNIVETAAALFNQKGFTGCSMGDIVAASGLEKGTLYGHFSTKEELALLAFEYAWKDTSDKRLRNIDTVSNAVEKLKLHIDNYVNTPSFPGGCPLLNFAVDADDGNLALRTRVRKALRCWEDLLAKIVEDGQSAGEIDPDIDPHFARGVPDRGSVRGLANNQRRQRRFHPRKWQARAPKYFSQPNNLNHRE